MSPAELSSNNETWKSRRTYEEEKELDLLDYIYNWRDSHGPLSIHARPHSMDDGRTLVRYMVNLYQLVEFDLKKQMFEGLFELSMVSIFEYFPYSWS